MDETIRLPLRRELHEQLQKLDKTIDVAKQEDGCRNKSKTWQSTYTWA
jgi:hypothetical protein